MAGYYEGDLCLNGNNNGIGDWSWIIGLALVGGLFGNGGFGFGGGFGGHNGFYPYAAPATQADLAAGFNNSAVLSSLNDLKLGQSSGFAAVQQTLCQGFNGIDRAIADTNSNIANAVCTLGYNTQSGFNSIANQIAQCCCDTRAAIADVKYANERQTCDIITSQNAQTQRLLDFLVGEKLSAKDARIASLEAQISNDRQTRTIVNELRDGCPIPAYLTCNPNAPYGYGYGVPFGYNGGCCGASVQ